MANWQSRRLPGWAFGVLVVLTSLIAGITLSAQWLHNTTLNTERFVDRVAPIAEDPDVQAALGDYLAEQLVLVVDLQNFIEEILPDQGQILAPVLSNAVEGFLAERATEFFASDTFDQLWTVALTRAHEAAINVIRGGGEVVSTQDGKVVLNLVPVINQILAEVESRVSGLVGRDVTLPEIDPGAPPSEAIQKLQDALGTDVTIPEDFGQIEIFDSDTLGAVQLGVEWFDKGLVALWVLTILLLLITIGLAPDRRRGVMWAALGLAATTVMLRRVVFATEAEIMDHVRVEARRAAADAIVDQIFKSYLDASVTIIVLALLAWLVAFAFGPSRPARLVREAGQRSAEATEDVNWIREHVALLRVAVIVVAAAFVLFTPLSFWGLLLVLVVAVLAEVWLGIVGRGAPSANSPAS